VRLDPMGGKASGISKPWTHARHNASAVRTELLGKHFVDFSAVDWSDLLHALGVKPRKALLVMDDHQDQLTRLQQAHAFGFRHLVFDDNFIPGVGDAFSIKDSCDGGFDGPSGGKDGTQGCGGGLLRSAFGLHGRRCTDFHAECKDYSPADMRAARELLLSLAEVVWEGPPVAPIIDPYVGTRALIRGKGAARANTSRYQYEGPTATLNGKWTWNSWHSRRVRESMKPPVLTSDEAASTALLLSRDYIDEHAGRYMNMVYVRLRDAQFGTTPSQPRRHHVAAGNA